MREGLLQPLHKNLLVSLKENPPSYLIVVPGKHDSNRGLVVRIGPDVTEVACGEFILFSKYDGAVIKFGGKEYLLIEENNVLAVIETS